MLPAFTGHAPCNQCGYDLHGLPLDGNCPECSRPVAVSLQGDELRFAATPYLETVSKGIRIYFIAGVTSLASTGIQMILGIASAAYSLGSLRGSIEKYFDIAGVGIAIASLIGFYIFTSPDPGRVAVEAPRSARALARVGLILSFIGTLGNFFSTMGPGMFTGDLIPKTVAQGVIISCMCIGFVMFFFYGLRYTEWLYRRVPDAQSVLTCRKYMWLLPLIAILGSCAVIGPFVAMWMHLSLLWKLRNYIVPILEGRTQPGELS